MCPLTARLVATLAVKLPQSPDKLALVSPYRHLEESWYEDEREWGWTFDPLDVVPDLLAAVAIAERFHPTISPTKDAADRERVREQLRSGLTPDQIYAAMGEKRAHLLTAIEEEARLEGELGASTPTPDIVGPLRDESQLRWERIAARVFGGANKTAPVRDLYDQIRGPGASAQSYTGRGRRCPDMR